MELSPGERVDVLVIEDDTDIRQLLDAVLGREGYAVAEAARNRGAEVTLITAPVALPRPGGMSVIDITTVAQLREAVMGSITGAHALVMAAAVSDFRVAEPAAGKIKKQGGGLVLELVENEDFLPELPDNLVKVGFAAESEDLVENARKKLAEKRLDLIVANDITAPDAGFDVDTNRVTFIAKDGSAEELPLLSKREVAEKILDRVAALFKAGA